LHHNFTNESFFFGALISSHCHAEQHVIRHFIVVLFGRNRRLSFKACLISKRCNVPLASFWPLKLKRCKKSNEWRLSYHIAVSLTCENTAKKKGIVTRKDISEELFSGSEQNNL
jgi:hypothetical protein